MAAKRRKGADAVPEETRAPRHLCHSVFGLFFSFSGSSSSTTVKSCSDSRPSLEALFWGPAAAQSLAALRAGAGWADAGGVVCGGAGHRNLAGTVSSCHWFIVLKTYKTQKVVLSILFLFKILIGLHLLLTGKCQVKETLHKVIFYHEPH